MAFGAGYAFAQAVFECGRAERIVERGKQSLALNRSKAKPRVICAVVREGVSRVPDLVPHSPLGSPLAAHAAAGMAGLEVNTLSKSGLVPFLVTQPMSRSS